MNWPTHSDYQEAIQNPHLCFQAPDLKAGEVVADMLGLPRVISGNFASVYELKSSGTRQAIRCFVRQVPGQQGRYILLSKYLANVRLDYLVKFDFTLQGILVHEQWYPIVQMEWVEGAPLNVWIEQHIKEPAKLRALTGKFREMLRGLRQYHLAHGDLQHGNIMVTPDNELRLVDYDGMFCPAFGRGFAPELGHPNFQHPRRSADFYEEGLDNFSALVIHTSLLALAVEPELLDKYYGADNLLLSSADYKEPAPSQVFERLKQSPDPQVQKLALLLQQCCLAPIEQTPWYEDTLVKLEAGEPLVLGTPAPPRRFPRISSRSASRSAPGSRPISRSASGSTPSSRSAAAPPPPAHRSYLVPVLLSAVLVLLLLIAGKLFFGFSKPGANAPAGNPADLPETPEVQATPHPVTQPAATPAPPVRKVALLGSLKGHAQPVSGLIISPDSRWFASGGHDGMAQVWNLQTGEKKLALPEHHDGVHSLAWFADGRTFATVAGDNIGRVWDLDSNVARKTVTEHQNDAWSPVFSPDGHTLAAGGSNRKIVRLIDWPSGAQRASLPEHKSWVRGADFSDDGRMLATYCFDDTVLIWNVANAQAVRTYNIATNGMDSIVFAPGGQYFATAAEKHAVKLWNYQSSAPQMTLTGHSGIVRTLAFAPSGKLLFSGGNDRLIQVWELPSGQLLQTITGQGGAVTALAVSRDNHILISASADNTIRLWDISKL